MQANDRWNLILRLKGLSYQASRTKGNGKEVEFYVKGISDSSWRAAIYTVWKLVSKIASKYNMLRQTTFRKICMTYILQPISPIPRNIMELDNVADTATDTPLKLMQTSAVIALFNYLTYRTHEPEGRSSLLLRDLVTGILFRIIIRDCSLSWFEMKIKTNKCIQTFGYLTLYYKDSKPLTCVCFGHICVHLQGGEFKGCIVRTLMYQCAAAKY